MAKRKHIKIDDETKILVSSLRRCCICFGLNQDFSVKKGQISHLDKDHNNSTLDNLAFLCLEHHDEYDSITSQSKSLSINEVKAYRSRLYNKVVTEVHKEPNEEYSFLRAAKDGHTKTALALLRVNIEYYLVALASASYVMAGLDTTMQEVITGLAQKGAITPREENLLSKMANILGQGAHGEVNSEAVDWAMEAGPILLKVLEDKLIMPYEIEF
jgi:hypothetical protein